MFGSINLHPIFIAILDFMAQFSGYLGLTERFKRTEHVKLFNIVPMYVIHIPNRNSNPTCLP